MSKKTASDIYAEFQKNNSSVYNKIDNAKEVTLEELNSLFAKPEKKKKEKKQTVSDLQKQILEHKQRTEVVSFDDLIEKYDSNKMISQTRNHDRHPIENISKSHKSKIRNIWKK